MAFHKPGQVFAPGSAPVTYESVVPNPRLKLLDQIREVMRLKHYSIRTEQSYCDWARRYVGFHQMHSRDELLPAEPKIEAFLSHLAVAAKVAVSTQNQAFNALLFLYREVLHTQLGHIEAVRATRPARVPTVLTPEQEQVSVLTIDTRATPLEPVGGLVVHSTSWTCRSNSQCATAAQSISSRDTECPVCAARQTHIHGRQQCQ